MLSCREVVYAFAKYGILRAAIQNASSENMEWQPAYNSELTPNFTVDLRIHGNVVLDECVDGRSDVE